MSNFTDPKPATFLQSPAGSDIDPSSKIKGMAPNFGESLLPHVVTFQGILSSVARVYRSPDEAIRDSYANARFMRNDPTIMECLEQRQRSTALLNWHLEAEDEKDERQKKLCEDLKAIIDQIPRFMQYRENLLHALWWGKYGIQHRYRWKKIRGQMRVAVDQWLPVNGDKIVFRFDDGTGMYDPDQVGVRVGAGFTMGNAVATRWSELRRNKVEPTDYGLAYFLEPWERRLLAIHKHMIEDGEYDEPVSAGKIHGLGIRSRIYWTWYQKQESLAWLMEFLERSAFGFEIWYYPMGNHEAYEQTKQAAVNRIGQGRNIVFMPRPADESGGMAYGVEKIEANMAGADTLERILREYFGHQIKRYILGQTLTTEADSTGLGSNLASVHLDTYLQIIRYDATNLEESLTTELIEPLKQFNFPEFRNVPIRFRIDTEAADVEGKLAAWERAWNMGVKLRGQDVMDLIGASKPESDEDVLLNPQIAQVQQQMEQQRRQEQQQAAMVAAGGAGAGLAGGAMVQGGLGDEGAGEGGIDGGPGLDGPDGNGGPNGDGGQFPENELWRRLQIAGGKNGNGKPESYDRLPGGKADVATPDQFDRTQLRRGLSHEMEHTDDPALALEIAMDHLAERSDYYTMLEEAEGTGVAGAGKREKVQAYSADSFPGAVKDGLDQTTAEEYVERVEKAAAETDTNQSDKQKAAGNYRKGKCRLHGMEIAIENPKGSVRRGADWQVTMPAHYGYIKTTESEADGDHIDVFLGPDLDSEVVFVIDQLTPGGVFDEHKCMIGWKSAEEAEAAYWKAYDGGYKGKVGAIVPMTMDGFKAWLEKGDSGHRAESQVEIYARPLSSTLPIDFRETDHPRGQPKNPGQFAPKGGGSRGAGRRGVAPHAAPRGNNASGNRNRGGESLPGGESSNIVNIYGHPHEVRIVNGAVWYKMKDNPSSFWQSAPENTATWIKGRMKEESDRRQRADQEKSAAKSAEAKKKLWGGLENGPVRGHILRRQLKIDLDTFTDAFFALAEAGLIHQDPKDGTIYRGAEPPYTPPPPKQPRQRRAPKENPTRPLAGPAKTPTERGKEGEGKSPDKASPKAPTPDLIVVKKSPEEIAAALEARAKADRELEQRRKAGQIEDRRTKREEDMRRLVDVATEYEIPPDDLSDAAKFVLEEKHKEQAKREAAKTDARKLTGLTQQDIGRLENAGHDYSSAANVRNATGGKFKQFDVWAQEIARQHPGVIGDPDDPNANFAAGLWDLIREGKQPLPSIYDPDILREAAQYVAVNKSTSDTSREELEAIPFSRREGAERYAKWLERQKQVRYVAEIAGQYFAEAVE